jgi:hypothetical protein
MVCQLFRPVGGLTVLEGVEKPQQDLEILRLVVDELDAPRTLHRLLELAGEHRAEDTGLGMKHELMHFGLLVAAYDRQIRVEILVEEAGEAKSALMYLLDLGVIWRWRHKPLDAGRESGMRLFTCRHAAEEARDCCCGGTRRIVSVTISGFQIQCREECVLKNRRDVSN